MFRNRTSICRRLFPLGILLGSLSPRAISDSPAKAAAPNSSIATARSEIGRRHIDSADKIRWDVLSPKENDDSALRLLGLARGKQQRQAEAETLSSRTI